MAQFNADINLNVKETNVDKAIRRLEQRLDRLKSKTESIEISPKIKALPQARGFRELKRRIDEVGKSLERFSSIGVGAGIVGLGEALNVAGRAAEQATASFKILGQSFDFSGPINSLGQQLHQATGLLDNLASVMQAIGPAGQATALGIGVASAAAVAFAPQIRGITKDLGTLTGGLNKFGQDVINALTTFEAGIGSTEGYRKAIQRLTDTVENLRKRQDNAQKALNKVNAQSEAAAAIRQTLVGITRRLNVEQRAQNALLEQATRAQREFNQQAQVGTNLARSRAGREGTGFGAFSRRAAGITDQTAVDKAIRRRKEQLARRPKAPIESGPLALPSTELLRATERGIQRIATTEEKVAEAVARTRREQESAVIAQQKRNREAQRLAGLQEKILKGSRAVNLGQDAGRGQFGPGNVAGVKQYEERIRLINLAGNLEQNWTKKLNSLRVKQDAARYRLQQKRIKQIADQQAAAQRDRSKFGQNLLLGVGFPLLFGGGAGSVLGSAAGSFVGDGFGGQIAGGAVGQAIDQYVQSLAELGSALNPATADTEKLIEALGETNTPFENLVDKLEKSGREATALALATQKMVDLVGQDGVDAMKNFGAESTRLGNEFARAMTLMNAGIAQVINNVGLFKALADQLGRANLINQARNSGNADQQARFERFEQAGVGFGTGTDPLAKAKEREAIMQEIIQAQIEINAEAEREAQIRARLAEFDAGKIREIRATVEEKRIELEIERLNAAANDETRIALEQKLAFQQLMTAQQALYNKFAADQISIDALRLELAAARFDYEAKIAKIANAAANYKAPRGGGGGRAERKSRVPELQAELQLSNQLLENDRQRLEAQFNGDTALINRLAQERINLELTGKKAAIALRDIPAAEKKLQLALAENQSTLQTLELKYKIEEADRKRIEALQGVTLPLQDEIELLKAKLNGNEDEIAQLQEIRRLKEQIAAIDPNADTSGVTAMVQQRDALRGQVEEMEKTKAMAQEVSNGIASAFTGAFRSVIDGSKSAEQALADAFKSIGDMFIDMAMKIIEQQLAMIINGMIMKALGIATGGPSMGGSGASQVPTSAYGDMSVAGPSFFGFAEGGFVTGPTNAVVGEAGEPEYVIPASKMDGAMSRYSAGQRGDAVITGADSDSGYGGTAVAEAPISVNISGGVTQMGGNDYIRKDELPSIINQSSKAGEARALRRLRQSPSTRRSVGL